jgi:hypothetical protein
LHLDGVEDGLLEVLSERNRLADRTTLEDRRDERRDREERDDRGSDNRTKRRSAEMTALIVSVTPPVCICVFTGTNTTWPPACTTDTCVTKNC